MSLYAYVAICPRCTVPRIVDIHPSTMVHECDSCSMALDSSYTVPVYLQDPRENHGIIGAPCECLATQKDDGSYMCTRCRGDFYGCECPMRHSSTCPNNLAGRKT